MLSLNLSRFSRAVIVLVLIGIGACQTTAPETDGPPPPVSEDPPARIEPVPPEDPVTEPPPPLPQDPPVFQVSEEVYNTAFAEIGELIRELNRIIAGKQFGSWRYYLDRSYIDHYSDSRNLAAFSESPILKKFNIRLRSLQDYFEYVVVPSRSSVKLDEIVFLDNNQVTAYMYVQGERTILYQLKHDGRGWKIALW